MKNVGHNSDRGQTTTYSTPGNLWGESETNHRVANSFSLISATVSNKARQIGKQEGFMSTGEVALLLKEIASRIASVGQLHQAITLQPGQSLVDIGEYLAKQCDALILSLSGPSQFSLIRNLPQPCRIRVDNVLPVSLIVAEVVTNSLKYAHPTGVPGRLIIGCQHEPDGAVIIEVADDGVGLPEGHDPAADKGFGTQAINLLARQIGAEVSFTSTPLGLRFRLRLPASAAG